MPQCRLPGRLCPALCRGSGAGALRLAGAGGGSGQLHRLFSFLGQLRAAVPGLESGGPVHGPGLGGDGAGAASPPPDACPGQPDCGLHRHPGAGNLADSRAAGAHVPAPGTAGGGLHLYFHPGAGKTHPHCHVAVLGSGGTGSGPDYAHSLSGAGVCGCRGVNGCRCFPRSGFGGTCPGPGPGHPGAHDRRPYRRVCGAVSSHKAGSVFAAGAYVCAAYEPVGTGGLLPPAGTGTGRNSWEVPAHGHRRSPPPGRNRGASGAAGDGLRGTGPDGAAPQSGRGHPNRPGGSGDKGGRSRLPGLPLRPLLPGQQAPGPAASCPSPEAPSLLPGAAGGLPEKRSVSGGAAPEPGAAALHLRRPGAAAGVPGSGHAAVPVFGGVFTGAVRHPGAAAGGNPQPVPPGGFFLRQPPPGGKRGLLPGVSRH